MHHSIWWQEVLFSCSSSQGGDCWRARRSDSWQVLQGRKHYRTEVRDQPGSAAVQLCHMEARATDAQLRHITRRYQVGQMTVWKSASEPKEEHRSCICQFHPPNFIIIIIFLPTRQCLGLFKLTPVGLHRKCVWYMYMYVIFHCSYSANPFMLLDLSTLTMSCKVFDH